MKAADRRIEMPLLLDQDGVQLIGCMVPVPESPEPAESPWSRWGSVWLLVALAAAAAAMALEV